MREVVWGEALGVEADKAPRGLQGVVEVIRNQVGPTIGSRNTFAKLFETKDPDDLVYTDRWRAWLLLTALGIDANDWGVPDRAVPKAHDPASLAVNLRVAMEVAKREHRNRPRPQRRRRLSPAASLTPEYRRGLRQPTRTLPFTRSGASSQPETAGGTARAA